MSLPESLGRLRRVRRIGAGGFATVWLYHDVELESPVAVKALADNWAERMDVRERFLQEARILRQSDSDHLVDVYDMGETEDGTPYFVMTFADLGTVGDLVEQGPQPLEEVVELMTQAADGLSALHAHGIIHRDVKPQNLLLRTDPRAERQVLVADLGVAKALIHATGLTQVVGTPAYMAPEQADVGTGLDVRADVHALGAVTYHLLTGRPMRDGGLGDLMRARLPAPPSALVALPVGVDRVILRAVAPDREDRWPSVDAFAVALGEAAGGPLVDGAAQEPGPLLPWWAIVLAALALLLGFAVGYVLLG